MMVKYWKLWYYQQNTQGLFQNIQIRFQVNKIIMKIHSNDSQTFLNNFSQILIPFMQDLSSQFNYLSSIYQQNLMPKYQIDLDTQNSSSTFLQQQYHVKLTNNIVIKKGTAQKLLKHQKIKKEQKIEITPKEKYQRKINQKTGRNVVSNLLRIFLKNILETKYFQAFIEKIIKILNLNIQKQQFYQWLQSFDINYKNYIRCTQLKMIFSIQGCNQQKRLLILIFRKFTSEFGVIHCLTSKRIQSHSFKMHLQGLRSIEKDICRLSKLIY